MNNTSSNNKRIAKNTLFMYMRMFLVMLVSLFTVRVLLRILGVEDYGVYNAIAGVVTSLSFVSSILAAASQRFFSFYLGSDDRINLKKSFSIIFFTYVIVVALLVLVAETAGLWFVLHKMTFPEGYEQPVMWVFQMAIATVVITLLASPFQALIISHEDMSIYASISIIEVILKLCIVYLLVILPFNKLSLYAILHFFVFLGVAVTYIVICRKRYAESHISYVWDKTMFRDIFSYSSWSMFGSVSGMCNTQGVNILLNIFFGPIANAAYSISAQVSSAINQFGNSFFSAVRPALIKSYAGGEYEYMNKLFLLSNKVLFLLMFIVILPIYVETKSILQLWLGNVEQYMVEFTRLSMIYTFLICFSNPITTIVQAANKVKIYHLLVDGFSLITLPIIYLLFKFDYSPVFAYVVSIVVFSIAHFLRLAILKNVVDYSLKEYFIKCLIPILFTVLLCAILSKFTMVIDTSNLLLSTIINCIIGVIITSFCGLMIVFSSTERNMLIMMIKDKLKK